MKAIIATNFSNILRYIIFSSFLLLDPVKLKPSLHFFKNNILNSIINFFIRKCLSNLIGSRKVTPYLLLTLSFHFSDFL